MDLGQSKFDPPDLSFVPGTILIDQLQLLIETGLLEGSLWSHVGCATSATNPLLAAGMLAPLACLHLNQVQPP